MGERNPKVDAYVKNQKTWSDEVKLLRELALDCGLQEDFKWSQPCYTSDGENIAIIQSFKNFCALMFFNGYLLKDPKKLLKAPGENSQSARRLEFTSTAEITKAKATIKAFVKETIKLAKSGEVPEKKPSKLPAMPAEFKTALAENKKLKAAFEKLTPGRQRLYLIHFSSAKQADTRISRIEKATPKILKGLGLNE
jgi:uncharacterized protein YdeI (YjbR/CyaY-like superfamily)